MPEQRRTFKLLVIIGRIWDVDTGRELTVLTGHDEWVGCVAWSPDGRKLATASNDHTARIWNPDNGNELAVLRGHDDAVRAVQWSADGRQMVTGSEDRTVRIWDTESGVEIIVVGAHGKGIEGVSWAPDGRRIASASQDGTARNMGCDDQHREFSGQRPPPRLPGPDCRGTAQPHAFPDRLSSTQPTNNTSQLGLQ